MLPVYQFIQRWLKIRATGTGGRKRCAAALSGRGPGLTLPVLLVLALLGTSCVSYYQSIYSFNSNFERGLFPEAEAALAKDKKAESRKTRLLYFLNRGVVASIQGKHEESNTFLEKAYLLGEDYQKNYLNEAASYLLNPNIVEYKGEDFELLLIHYYKALNFLKLGDKEAALVECKRMDIKMSRLSSKYTSENKFQRDAFVHTLMGIIYDANGDDNNAFIAYRNALEVYKSDYQRFFGLDVPHQLKADLLRSAYRNNFTEELRRYEQEFGMKYQPSREPTGDLVFFWHSGLGPIKVETGITFAIRRGQGGMVNFTNEAMSLNFSFPVDDSTYYKSGLSSLEFVRIVFPKYVERPAMYTQASLSWQQQTHDLDKAEDVNAVAFKTLNQRMLLEVGKSLLRVALKKASEYKLRQENDNMGAALGLFNALTEQADTRSWQSVPHSIYYTRLSLPPGNQTVQLSARSVVQANSSQKHSFSFDVKPGNTLFHTFHSLETDHRFRNALYSTY
jgi:uncharacterized protein